MRFNALGAKILQTRRTEVRRAQVGIHDAPVNAVGALRLLRVVDEGHARFLEALEVGEHGGLWWE